MDNRYAPPNADLELREPPSARPRGIKVLAVLFILFSVASTFLAYLDDMDGEWLVVLGCSLLLIILLRGVYRGLEKDRKTGVFLGFFIALLNLWGFYEPSETYAELQKLLYVSESVYGVAGAVYLMKMKGSGFFK